MPSVPIRITEDEAEAIMDTRPDHGDRNKAERLEQRQVFASIKRRYGLDPQQKIKIEIDDEDADDYLVLKDKRTGKPFFTFSDGPQRAQRAAEPGSEAAAAERATASFADHARRTFSEAEDADDVRPAPPVFRGLPPELAELLATAKYVVIVL